MDKEAFEREQEGARLTKSRAQQLNDINDIGRDYAGILKDQVKEARELHKAKQEAGRVEGEFVSNSKAALSLANHFCNNDFFLEIINVK